MNTAVDVQHTFRPPLQHQLGMLQSLERAKYLPALGLAVLAIDPVPDGYRPNRSACALALFRAEAIRLRGILDELVGLDLSAEKR